MSFYLFVDSTNCSGFRKYSCGFRKLAYYGSDFERYSVLGICLWNPKQQRKSKKCSNIADSAKNLIWACCGIRLQYAQCTVWPRNDLIFETKCCIGQQLTAERRFVVLAHDFAFVLSFEFGFSLALAFVLTHCTTPR